jgi:Tfp pilus assembly protein PilN
VRPWLVVWLLVTLLTTVAVVVVVAALVRQVVLLGRTAGKLQDETGPLTDEIAAASARAADTAATLSSRAAPGGAARSRGRR